MDPPATEPDSLHPSIEPVHRGMAAGTGPIQQGTRRRTPPRRARTVAPDFSVPTGPENLDIVRGDYPRSTPLLALDNGLRTKQHALESHRLVERNSQRLGSRPPFERGPKRMTAHGGSASVRCIV